MFAPFATWISMYLSAHYGVCGMSATHEWDPDGAGIRKITDAEFARAMWNKAKKLHLAQVALSLGLTFAFVRSPL